MSLTSVEALIGFALLLAALVLGGWLGNQFGTWLARHVNAQKLPMAFMGLFAFNATWLAFICGCRWRLDLYRADSTRVEQLKAPVLAGALAGIQVHGISGWIAIWLLSNGLVAYLLLLLLLPRPVVTDWEPDAPPSDPSDSPTAAQ